MNKNSGNILVIILALGLLIAIFTGALIWRSKFISPTTNKQVVFDKLGLSLSLPPQWYAHKETLSPGGKNYGTTISYPVDNPSSQASISDQKVSMNMSVALNDTRSISDRIGDYTQGTNSLKLSNIKYRIGGEDAVALDSPTGQYRMILVRHRGDNYFISVGFLNNENAQELFPIFDQILSTIKFIDNNSIDRTSSWPIVNFSSMISFKVPPEVQKPLCANTGCYAKETQLPGGSYFQIWGADGASPGGKESSWDYNAILGKLTDGSFQQQTYDISGHRAIGFSSNQRQDTFIMGGEIYSQIKGVFIETKNGMLMVAHYLPKNADPNAFFDNDKVLFNQILSTLKFLDQ